MLKINAKFNFKLMRIHSVFFLVSTLLCSCSLGAPPRSYDGIEFGSKPINSGDVLDLLRDKDKILHWPSAHRAKFGSLADNSLAGIGKAVELGVPLLEIDIRNNPSGDIFLFHDRTLKPHNYAGLSKWQGKDISSLSTSDLVRISHPGRPRISIPFLEQALQHMKGKAAAFQMDMKHETVENVESAWALATRLEVTNQLIFQLKSGDRGAQLRAKYPKMGLLYRAKTPAAALAALSWRPDIIELEGWSDPQTIQQLHAGGVRVLVNLAGGFLDTRAHWQAQFSQGVDIVMTDKADEMLRYLGALKNN